MKLNAGIKTVFLIFFLVLSTGLFASIQAEDAASPAAEPQSSDSSKLETSSPSAAASAEAPAPQPAAVEEIPEPLQIEEPETNTQFRPEVIIAKVGEELNLKVKYSHAMDFANDNAIDYVRMETLTGEFLGLMTYNDKFTEAAAEFMINPTLANFDQIKLVAKSSKVGLIKSIHKLEITPVELPPAPEVTAPTPAAENDSSQEKPRKKRFGLF